MKDVVYILFGAAFTVSVAIALGSLLLDRLRLTLFRQEAVLFAFVSGAALLSLASFLFCVLQIAHKGVFLAGGAVVIFWAWRRLRGRPPREALPAAPRYWNVLFGIVFAGFFILYFFNALAPEISPDGSGYHLANVARYWRHHGFVYDHHSMYSYFPQGMEMLFLVAFVFGHYSAAALIHFTFLVTLPLLIACYGRRCGFPRVGLFAAVLVYASPVAGKDGISAYNDLTVAVIVFSTFYLLQIWDETREFNLLSVIGLVAGFAYAVKYTAALTIPFAAGYLLWRMRHDKRQDQRMLRGMAALTALVAVMVLPWVLRNWIWLGNPFAPFLNHWFPNPYFHPGTEQSYLADVRTYPDLQNWRQIFWWRLVTGRGVGGMIGPIFLLAPVGLLAWRHSAGRRLLVAALIFGIPGVFNSGSRFLIPVLPFVSLAMGQAMAKPQFLLPALALLHAVASYPPFNSRYANRYSWRLESIPVAAALRIESEPSFLIKHLEDYSWKYVLESKTPPNARILTIGARENGYINRDMFSFYESALGNLGFDLLNIPFTPDFQPTVHHSLRFSPVMARRLRVVQTASAESYWTISEMRALSQGREVPRSSQVSAQPNPWEANLAFDSNYASRWSSWEKMTPGMFVSFELDKLETVDEVSFEAASLAESKVAVEVSTEDGHWTRLNSTAEQKPFAVPPDLRHDAIRVLKAQGVSHLLLLNDDIIAPYLLPHLPAWRLTEVGGAGRMHLLRIDD